MMTRKKRITILVVIIVLILIILAATFVFLYLNTDMFKSNKTLFAKYLGKNTDNIKALEMVFNSTDYDEQLKTSPYNENVEIGINYTQNIGTTEENTEHPVNQLKIAIDGQTDNNNIYDYRNVKLLKNDEQIAQAEYLHSSNNYGIKFTDLFSEYIVSENTNLKELFRKIGYSDEEVQNIPDTVTFDKEVLSNLRFSDEELGNLIDKYVGIISQNISPDNFSRQRNQTINIDGQNYIANAYVLTLTKEQLNNIYINLLQNIKQDEIILSKMDILQNKVSEITLENVSINLREDIINRIDRAVQRISQSNIGTEETKIIVYESGEETIRTRIETQDYQINIDSLLNQYAEVLVANGEEEKYKVTFKNNSNNLSVVFENNNNESILTFEKSEEINNQTRNQNYRLIYQLSDKEVSVGVRRTTEVMQIIESVQNFSNENAVMLNTLEDAQAQEIINTVRTGINTELEMIKQEISYQEIEQMLKDIGLIRNSNVLGSSGTTETEKNRFNSTFEFLQGEKLTSERVSSAIQTIKNNIGGMEIVSNSELRLNIVRGQANEEVVNTLTTFLDNNKNNQYNINIEYDENGLVNQLIITIVEDT